MKTNCSRSVGHISIVCLLCSVVPAVAVERYVSVNNPTPAAPYSSWATAANNIQAAIDAASTGDVITVTNGVYQTGTGVVNRVSVSKPLLVRSVNGPSVTIVDGGGTMRCVELSGNAILSGFTLTNGNVIGAGGGARGENLLSSRLTNCIITGNISSTFGGGAYFCGIDNCVVSNNYSGQSGGGTAICSVNNSAIVNNVAAIFGGGVDGFATTNCFISGNTAASGGGARGTFNTPTPPFFVNCIFVNNWASDGSGGGVFAFPPSGVSTLCQIYNCAFTNNSASAGGGVSWGKLYDSALVGNHATNGVGEGGGANNAYLERCLVLGNFAKKGGGVVGGTYRSVVAGNSASIAGGGIYGGNGSHQFTIITNNFATDGGGFASGDAFSVYSDFYSCLFSGNQATNRGGAVDGFGGGFCELYSCTVAGNSAGNEGGGLNGVSGVYNSIIYHNSAPLYPNGKNFEAYNSCITPMPANGGNNITNDPAFANMAAGNFRLSSNSPCINYIHPMDFGAPGLDPELSDLDGNPRLAGEFFDLGAYEFQSPSSVISYLWLQQHGLPTDGSADYADQDGDLFNNYSEWRARTEPFNAASLLKFTSISVVTNPTPQVRLEWQSVPGVYYSLEGATNATGPFTAISTLGAISTNTIGEIPLNLSERSWFFKVGVW